jgi:hypothetical protein
MSKKELIEEAIASLRHLDEQSLIRVNKLLRNILNNDEDSILSLNASLIAAQSGALDFLNDEPDLYSDADALTQLR